jgi:AraC-like DNA-binding protein
MEVPAFIPQFLKVYGNIVIFAGHHVIAKTHAYHALEIIIAFDSFVVLETSLERFEEKALLLKHDLPHSTHAKGLAVFIYINPEITLGKRLNLLLAGKNVLSLEKRTQDQLRNYISDLIINNYSEDEITLHLTNTLMSDITQIEKNYALDRRIVSILDHISKNLHRPLDFNVLKEIACLSDSRLIHLFKKEIGIPIRKYVLWCRLQHAIRFFLKGNSWTQSAHIAGFSDVAHLTRTFVSMFGLSPSQILKNF